MTRHRDWLRGWSLAARLLVVAVVPTTFMIQLASANIRDRDRTLAAADRLEHLVDLERLVATASGPLYIEYLGHLGLATIDDLGVDRVVVADVTGLDYEGVYKDIVDELDQVIADIEELHGELGLAYGRSLGGELRRLKPELRAVRRATEDRRGDRDAVAPVFETLREVLAEAVDTERASFDDERIPGELERFRAESTGFGWVLTSAGDKAEAVLEALVMDMPEHRVPVALVTGSHQQAIDQFTALLTTPTAAAFRTAIADAPDPLPNIVEKSPVAGQFDLEIAIRGTSEIMAQMDYLGELSAWADSYYQGITVEVRALADDARDSLERTWWIGGVTIVGSVLLIVVTSISLLRPLLRLGRRARDISHGRIDLEPLPMKGPRDLRNLTRTMNNMHSTLRLVDQQAEALAAGRLDDPSLAAASPGRLGESIRSSVERLTTVTGQLTASEARSSAIVSHATVAIWTIDRGGSILSANNAAEFVLLEPEGLQVGRRLVDLLGTLEGECEVVRPDGSRLALDVDNTAVPTSRGLLRTVIAEDVTERKEFERRLAYQARHDALTGLPNRFAVLERLAEMAEAESTAAILYLDIDGFKTVNDTGGHGTGDHVLVQIGERLKSEVRSGTMVARLGGDEFVVVVDGPPDIDVAVRVGRRLIERIEQPFELPGMLFAISASVGVAVMHPGDAPLDVVHRADSAVYRAKARGRGRVELFSELFQAEVEQHAELELALREAVANGDVEMYLQPIFDLSSGQPTGAEALARWYRPGIGFIPPSDFIAAAEHSPLIFELTRGMLLAACRRVVAWRQQDPSCRLRISVNITGRHLIDADLVGDITAALVATGADPCMLEIELTETHLLAELGPAREVLDAVRAMGVTVAIDDFGTGFSSMAYLRQLSVDVIKVDRSFVSGAGQDGFDSSAIDAMVNFGRVLGVHVVAEGVETETQLDFVRSHGCTRAQGYLLGYPVPPVEAERALGLAGAHSANSAVTASR